MTSQRVSVAIYLKQIHLDSWCITLHLTPTDHTQCWIIRLTMTWSDSAMTSSVNRWDKRTDWLEELHRAWLAAVDPLVGSIQGESRNLLGTHWWTSFLSEHEYLHKMTSIWRDCSARRLFVVRDNLIWANQTVDSGKLATWSAAQASTQPAEDAPSITLIYNKMRQCSIMQGIYETC